MKKVAVEILILLLVSSFVIFFQFNQVPKKLSWDEVEFTRLALSLDNKPYTAYSQLATGHSTLYFYILLTSFKIFGINNFALRFPSALFGIFNVMLFYFIALIVFPSISYFRKGIFQKKLQSFLPLTASLIFLTLRWYFNFARFSFEATFLVFLELVSIYFFIKFIFPFRVIPIRQLAERNLATKGSVKNKKYASLDFSVASLPRNDTIYLILSSFFSGLAFMSYYPGRIFFLLPLFFLLLYSEKNLIKQYIFIFLIIFSIVASPLIFYLLSHKDIRVQEQLFLTNKKLSLSKKVSNTGENVIKLASMFNLQGDLNGRHNYPGKPILNPVVGAFFILGLLVTILNLQLFYNRFFLTYFFLSLLPTLLTYPSENPNSLRTFTAIVPSVFFVGNGIIYLLQSENHKRKLYYFVVAGIIVLFFLSALYDMRTYFVYQRQVFRHSFELPGTVSKILKLKLWEKTNYL